MANTVTGKLERIERLPSSYLGNPRFSITLEGLDSYPTLTDGAVGYEVENYKVGKWVTLTFNRGRVIDICYRDGDKA